MTLPRVALLSSVLCLSLGVPSAATQAVSSSGADGGKPLVTRERLQTLSRAERSAWTSYIDRSRRLHDADTASMHAELRAAGLTRMTKATYRAMEFDLVSGRNAEWFASDSATKLADAVLTHQTPSGGWSKRSEMSLPRPRGTSYYSESDGWHYIPTLDNGATTSQLAFLQRVAMASGQPRHVQAYRRGISFLLAAQQPNGCWPQSFPLEGGYHDAITFNDDVSVLALRRLGEAADSLNPLPGAGLRDSARAGEQRGVGCLVRTQVEAKGVRTVWGQQHDPFTLEIVPARGYELAGLSGRESAGIMTYLMTVKVPGPDIVAAVHAAADFFRANVLRARRYDVRTGPEAGTDTDSTWARLYEIGTNRPIFANRDGRRLYDWNELTDRRTGYAWFGREPETPLKRYVQWSRAHPRTAATSDIRVQVRKP